MTRMADVEGKKENLLVHGLNVEGKFCVVRAKDP